MQKVCMLCQSMGPQVPLPDNMLSCCPTASTGNVFQGLNVLVMCRLAPVPSTSSPEPR